MSETREPTRPRRLLQRSPTLVPQVELFRQEAVAERQAQWLGSVLLEPRVSQRVFVWVAATLAFAVLALLLLGSYTRKERINGWLMPEQGIVRVFAPQQAVVARIDVHDGARVAKGAPLVVLSTELQSGTIGATREQIVRRITSRRDSIVTEQLLQQRLFDQQADGLRKRLDTLTTEQAHLVQEIELMADRVRLAEKAVRREKVLYDKILSTEARLQKADSDRMAQTGGLQTLERSRSALQRQRVEAQTALQDLPFQRQAKLADMERAVSALEQELAEAESRREIVLSAPHDGTISNLQIEIGGNARPDVPLLTIVPSGAVLRAELFSPGRAIGFIRTGQRVLLRYRAFPYQKFGFYEGIVASVSPTAVGPSELPRQLAGLTSLFTATEPVYRLTVDLASQSVVAYGKEVPLQPGMQLEADVQIETRRLVEWLLLPLFSLTQRAGR